MVRMERALVRLFVCFLSGILFVRPSRRRAQNKYKNEYRTSTRRVQEEYLVAQEISPVSTCVFCFVLTGVHDRWFLQTWARSKNDQEMLTLTQTASLEFVQNIETLFLNTECLVLLSGAYAYMATGVLTENDYATGHFMSMKSCNELLTMQYMKKKPNFHIEQAVKNATASLEKALLQDNAANLKEAEKAKDEAEREFQEYFFSNLTFNEGAKQFFDHGDDIGFRNPALLETVKGLHNVSYTKIIMGHTSKK